MVRDMVLTRGRGIWWLLGFLRQSLDCANVVAAHDYHSTHVLSPKNLYGVVIMPAERTTKSGAALVL